MESLRDLEATIESWLRTRVCDERFRHSMRVKAEAAGLAAVHGVEAGPLRLAALFHDCAREIGHREAILLAEEWEIPVRPFDRMNPVLLHGPLGARIARVEFGIRAPGIGSAISYHTAGHPDMNVSDMLLFLADAIEPGREFPGLEMLRPLALRDIDGAMLLAIDLGERYLGSRNKVMDPLTHDLRKMLRRRDPHHSLP